MRNLLFPWFCFCLMLSASSSAIAGGGADMTMRATLVWGCDDEKPKDEKLKAVDPELAKKLKGIFKWKHYYEVKTENALIADKATKKFVLSDKCTVEVKNEGKTYKAKLFGEGKQLKELDQPIEKGASTVLAGDDKNSTAWFVVLTPQ